MLTIPFTQFQWERNIVLRPGEGGRLLLTFINIFDVLFLGQGRTGLPVSTLIWFLCLSPSVSQVYGKA